MELSGKIAADRILKLKFLIGGTLRELNAKTSQTVRKGQLLARLDQTELQTYLDRALKYYEQMRAEFDEKQGKNLNEYEKRKVQAELDVSVKNIEIAKINLEATNLYAPIDGIIIEVDPIAVGTNITPGNFIITLLDHQSFYFEAPLKEEDLGKIKADLPAKVVLKAFPDKTISGKVDWISYTAVKEGIFNVRVSLDDKSELKIGMTGTVNIIKENGEG